MIIDWKNLPAGEHSPTLLGAAGNIEAKLHLPDRPPENPAKAIVICCHPHPQFGGTMTNKVVHTLAKTFSKMGVPALRFNFRGIGYSEGKYDEGKGESEDLLLLSELMRKSWPEQELWLAGFSFGSWIAASCASASGAKQLLSVAPPVRHFSFSAFRKPTCPWLVLMGEQDDVVEPDSVFEWVNSQEPPPKLIKFPETGHFFHGQIVNMSNVLEQHYQPIIDEL